AKVDNKQHVYLVGMNDGTMPQPVTASSLITDEEKKYFEQQANVDFSQIHRTNTNLVQCLRNHNKF
ncbi:hypothetical protein B8A22_15065, partial [Staphylococcus aureus]